jgi:NitT/TauT family transport system ATP-binding protein
VILVTHDLREAAFLADTVHVMSNRPGHIVSTHTIDLPRPRTLETTFQKEFVDIYHVLRDQISHVRSGGTGAAKVKVHA